MSDHAHDPPDLATRFKTHIHRLSLGGKAGGGGAGRAIDLLAPANPDALLDDPEVEKRYKADNYMPYWPILWPSALMLAEKILLDQTSPPAIPASQAGAAGADAPDRRCLELGCGLGLAGIAAALRGWHVTFTDYDREAVQFAAHNARRNGVPEHLIRALEMDWRNPLPEKFPWILASDVLYERRLHPLLLSAIGKLLAPAGVAWVCDPQRTSAEDFPLAAVAAGFHIQTARLQCPSTGGGTQAGDLYILRWHKGGRSREAQAGAAL